MAERRLFLKSSTAALLLFVAPPLIAADGARPVAAQGLQLRPRR